jgi:Tfp pilus assembly protein PilO
MSRISKQKQTQLVLVVLLTLLVVGGLWYSLISYQQVGLQKLEAQRKSVRDKLSQIQQTIQNSKEIEAGLLAVSNKLSAQEEDMAYGDLYSSMVNTIRKFKLPYRIDIPQMTSGGSAAEVNLLPKFPYKQVSMIISGTAFYFDFGRFLADFENRFPHSRVLNLELTPASASRPEEKEKLAFRVEIVSLVKPGGSRPANTP